MKTKEADIPIGAAPTCLIKYGPRPNSRNAASAACSKVGEHIDQCSAMNDNPLADTATFQVGSNDIVGGNLLIEFIRNLGYTPEKLADRRVSWKLALLALMYQPPPSGLA